MVGVAVRLSSAEVGGSDPEGGFWQAVQAKAWILFFYQSASKLWQFNSHLNFCTDSRRHSSQFCEHQWLWFSHIVMEGLCTSRAFNFSCVWNLRWENVVCVCVCVFVDLRKLGILQEKLLRAKGLICWAWETLAEMGLLRSWLSLVRKRGHSSSCKLVPTSFVCMKSMYFERICFPLAFSRKSHLNKLWVKISDTHTTMVQFNPPWNKSRILKEILAIKPTTLGCFLMFPERVCRFLDVLCQYALTHTTTTVQFNPSLLNGITSKETLVIESTTLACFLGQLYNLFGVCVCVASNAGRSSPLGRNAPARTRRWINNVIHFSD